MQQSTESIPLLWQRRLGFLGVLLALPGIPVLISMGLFAEELTRVINVSPEAVLPTTPVMAGIARFLQSYWYLPTLAMVVFYWRWMSKSATRLIWCNAILALAIPFTIVAFSYFSALQQEIAHR